MRYTINIYQIFLSIFVTDEIKLLSDHAQVMEDHTKVIEQSFENEIDSWKELHVHSFYMLC